MMLVYRLAEVLQHEIHAVREVLQDKYNEVLQDEIEKAFLPVFLFSVPLLIINNSGALKETWATNHSKMFLAKVCLGAGGQKELSQGCTDRTPAGRQAGKRLAVTSSELLRLRSRSAMSISVVLRGNGTAHAACCDHVAHCIEYMLEKDQVAKIGLHDCVSSRIILRTGFVRTEAVAKM
jgi:hypothetical protein